MLDQSSYDVFLSYKAEDANDVRAVAEDLLGHNVRVWFAEYVIPSKVYDDDNQIQIAIDRGVDRAGCHVVFTNKRWAHSEWCRSEMRRILDLPEGERRLLQVYHPEENEPRNEWPILDSTPSVRYDGDRSIVRSELARRGWISRYPHSIQEQDPLKNPRRQSLGYGVSFKPDSFRDLGDLPWFFQEALREPGDHYFMTGHVKDHDVHLLIDINPHATVLGALEVEENGTSDDRELYRSYVRYTSNWMGRLGRGETGLHLVFLEGRSHFAVTSVSHADKQGDELWERRYALLLKGPGNHVAGELGLTFVVALSNRNPDPTLAQFCRLTPTFDRIVASVRTRVDFSTFQGEWRRISACRLLLLLIVWCIADLLLTQARTMVGSGAGLLCLGFSLASFLAVLIDKNSRWRESQWGTLYGPKTRFLVTFGRWFDRAWNYVVGALVQDTVRATLAICTPCGWLLVGGLFLFTNYHGYWFACGVGLSIVGTVFDAVLFIGWRDAKRKKG